MNKIKIGIDASRNRSGGAQVHIIEILKNFNYKKFNNIEIHIWSYPELLNKIDNKPWINKHAVFEKQKSIFSELFWQRFIFKKLLHKNQIDILLNTTATSVCKFQPSISMSRDMLSYEKGIMKLASFSIQWVRLQLLKYIQINSLKKSTGAIFLTNYASNEIQKFTGEIKNFRIINHCISDSFRFENRKLFQNKKIKCVYISNIDFYKNHKTLIQAFLLLKDLNIELSLIGGKGKGKPALKEERTIKSILKRNSTFNENIKFKGHINHSELSQELKKYDIFIFASSCENMPNTLVEGMASALPVICSDKGPMPEILEDGGIYFNPENINSTYNALNLMIYDKSLQKKSSIKSYELSKKYSWAICSDKTFQFLIDTYLR